jgi:hypothetical protein
MSEENFEQPIDPISLGSSEPEGEESVIPKSINRPAEGARIASPDEVLGGSFGGSQSAGDFLGLDTELTDAMAPRGLELFQAPDSLPLEEEAIDPGSLLASPAPQVDDEQFVDADGEFIGEAESDEFSAEYDEEHAEDYDEEFEDSFDGAQEPALSKFKLVGAFAAGLVVVLGVTLGPQLISPSAPNSSVEIAQGPPAISTQPGQPQPIAAIQPSISDVNLAPVSSETPEPLVEPGAESMLDPQPEVAQPEVQGSLPEIFTPDVNETPVVDVAGAEALGTEIFGFEGDPLDSLTTDGLDAGASTAGVGGAFPDFGKSFQWATSADLDMIWRGADVPLQAIHAPGRMMMPYVGMVRVTLNNGSSLDGKLHSLGEGSVWISRGAQGNRVGLDGGMVTSIERLAVEVSSVGTSKATSGTAMNKKVRIKLIGRSISGTLIAKEGSWVTLRLPSGGEMKFENPEMEEVTQERVILLRD